MNHVEYSVSIDKLLNGNMQLHVLCKEKCIEAAVMEFTPEMDIRPALDMVGICIRRHFESEIRDSFYGIPFTEEAKT